jgi:hypothetical protein
MKNPVTTAPEAARELLLSHADGRDVPSASELLATVRSFMGIEFDVPDGDDADGLLFQFGTVNWLPEPTFVLGFTRQLALVDHEGEHESYFHVQLDYHYPVVAALEELPRHSAWWFRGEATPLADWLEQVAAHPVWSVVADVAPRSFSVSQEIA